LEEDEVDRVGDGKTERKSCDGCEDNDLVLEFVQFLSPNKKRGSRSSLEVGGMD
jgi:hypothetical protein